jgi:hypothetical protein
MAAGSAGTGGGDDAGVVVMAPSAAARGVQAFAPGRINLLLTPLMVRLAVWWMRN